MVKSSCWLSLGKIMLLGINRRGLNLHRVLLWLLLKRKRDWSWINHLCTHVHGSARVVRGLHPLKVWTFLDRLLVLLTKKVAVLPLHWCHLKRLWYPSRLQRRLIKRNFSDVFVVPRQKQFTFLCHILLCTRHLFL